MNLNFLKNINLSFQKYLVTSARSNEKLKILHGCIAQDLKKLLGKDYVVESLGIGNGREQKIIGRYTDKVVDIRISRGNEVLAGIAIKYVMSNYSQNSNNYFEGMLGETANIRTANIAYFQILILPEEMPYFKKDGNIGHIEEITQHNLDKYIKLSEDNTDVYYHTPNKMLLVLLKMPKLNLNRIKNKSEYVENYKNIKIKYSNKFKENFDKNIIMNDYELFMDKIQHYIKSI